MKLNQWHISCDMLPSDYCLNFQCIRDSLILLFLFSIYKIVNIMDVYKSLNISTRIIRKNPKMLKFAPDHLKTKKCENMQLKNYLMY